MPDRDICLSPWGKNVDLVKRFALALAWVRKHSSPGQGIAVSSKQPKKYPEVSGYFIPTLLDWNEKSLASTYGQWLCETQNSNGSWFDPSGIHACVFDTGQILKGLVALHEIAPSPLLRSVISKGCDWIVSHIGEKGILQTPDEAVWRTAVPLGVLLYALEPVRRAGTLFEQEEWLEKVDVAVAGFLARKDLTDFTHLSHFHAYILEALCDLGHKDRAAEGMKLVAALQRSNGAVPAFRDVRWVCSTGLFQYAIVWYKLGDKARGDAAFACAAKLQNRSGGWYGSYGWFAKYFPKVEISWAVKYFMDAFRLKLLAAFEDMAPIFSEHIDAEDGRYLLTLESIRNSKSTKILDAGCGKGRYLRLLAQSGLPLELHGADLSHAVMETIPAPIKTAQGSLLSLPYADESFDFVYTCEALEHAVHLDGALRELARVLKPGGTLLVIDKDIRHLGRLKLPAWEQWFGVNDLADRIAALNFSVETILDVPYEGRRDKLFAAWRGRKN
jgi:malonyl-CoA O-methyltransferase